MRSNYAGRGVTIYEDREDPNTVQCFLVAWWVDGPDDGPDDGEWIIAVYGDAPGWNVPVNWEVAIL